MAAEHKPGMRPNGKPPEGSQPKDRTPQDEKRIRDEASGESSGDSPMDPKDEEFIDSK